MQTTQPSIEPDRGGAVGTEFGPVLARVLDAWLSRQGALLSVKDAASGRYVYVNEAMARFLGRSTDEVCGRGDAELVDPGLATSWRASEQAAMAQPHPVSSEHRFEWAGQRHDFAVLRMAVEGGAEGRRWLCAVWTDQTPHRHRESQLRAALEQLEEQQRANEKLRLELTDQGLRDTATGLYTRPHFEDQLRREVDLSTREHREFALVFIEIDPFNDRVHDLGALAEARIFEAMGRLLRGNTRAMDASCRLDERRFAVLLSGVGLATAHSRMEGLRRQCATQIVVLNGQELGFSVSMGVASFPHTAASQQELLAACEGALAEARRRGGNHLALASIRFETG
jgi:diguanylate cyclase (GGDEF)-like protein/PAS domain S-box-containing protein